MDFTEVYQEIRKAAAIAITAQELMKGDETFRELFDAQQCILRRLTEKLKALEKEPAPGAAPRRYARHSDPDRIRRTVNRSPAARAAAPAEDPCSTPGQDPEQLGSSRAAQAERGRTE